MKRTWAFAALLACLLQFGTGPTTAQSDGPLKYLNSSFVTGDVVVGGTSLFRRGVNGYATRVITISGVPAEAEILSAYLYIQSTVRESAGEDAGIVGAQFKGYSLNTAGGPVAKALNWADGTQACWSYGWNPRRRLVTYRADVLRFLTIGANGKHVANGDHTVRVADSGPGGLRNDDLEDSPSMTGPRAVGASLVLVYRSADPAAPLRSIVIYDGGVTKRSTETFTQRIQGFYEPSASPDARMTHLVGDGQLLFSEKVQFGAQAYGANPYIGRQGPRWDNPTFALGTALKPYPDAANQNRLIVQPNGLLSDCLSWSAIVVSTKVQDTDGDGLLDLWESPGEVKDPTGQTLPNLAAMGANKLRKDLFVEIGFLRADADLTYGTGADAKIKRVHDHLPSLEALSMVASAFDQAPVQNPDTSTGIKVHFDVGNRYQANRPEFIVPAGPGLGIGGQSASETACFTAAGAAVPCPAGAEGQYPAYPGTVGWKTGYRFYRDDVLKFSRVRKDIFRYALFAHALGIPKEENEFLTTGAPNPAFHVPRTNSGVGDWAGADVLVTLGAFDDAGGYPVGTPFMQAATLMHEWGHNFGRRHGGDLREPNCKPQYLSVMNYLYQLRGLLDAGAVPRLDFNRGTAAFPLDEGSLTDTPFSGLTYRMGWYAPKAESYLKNQLGGTATKYCDGSPLPIDPTTGRPVGPEMVRVDATSLVAPIDWNADTQAAPGVFGQDLNYDGAQTQLRASDNEWPRLRLNQVGSRRSIGGLFVDAAGRLIVGPLSLNAGKGDLGKGDLGKGDLGKGDLGKGDLGKGDLGKGDLGKGDLGTSITLGKGDLGKGDLGGGDLDVGSGIVGAPDQFVAFEVDAETAAATTGGNPTPPSALQACLTSDGVCVPAGGDRPVRLNWLAPNIGQVSRYFVYRFVVSEPFVPPAQIVGTDLIATLDGEGVPPTTYLDTTAPPGASLAYVIVAQFSDGRDSGISNFATVTTPEVVGGPVLVEISGEAAIHDGSPKPVSISTTPPGVPVTVRYGPEASTTAPSAFGAYLVQATANAPYVGSQSKIQTIASTTRAGGAGGGPANSFCAPGAFARGLRPSTNGYYGLLGYQLLCNAGDSPARVAGPLNPSYGHTVYTEADAVCDPGEVMVGVHGSIAAPFGFTVVQKIGPRCQTPGSDVFHDVGPVGGGTNPGTAFSLQCDYPHAVRAVVGGVGEVADGVALVCAALPALPTVTSVSPAVGKPGEGFLVVRGTNLPAVAGSSAVVRNGETTGTGFIFISPSTPSAYFVRLPSGFPLGPTTIEIQNGATSSTAFPITVAATPGTPVITNVYDASVVATTQVVPGATVHVAADGIDTSGAVVRFQQGEAVEDVPASGALSNGAIGLVVAVTVPSLAPGSVDVSVRQGASAFSTPVVLTVPFP